MAILTRTHQDCETIIRESNINIGPMLTQLSDYLQVAIVTRTHQGCVTIRRSSINIDPTLTQRRSVSSSTG